MVINLNSRGWDCRAESTGAIFIVSGRVPKIAAILTMIGFGYHSGVFP
jgi:hypothetical protein